LPESSILGTLNLLKYCQNIQKFIFASSGGAIYGDTKNLPTPETEIPNPLSPYGIAKLAVEKFGVPFEELDTQRRSRLRTGRYSERPVGQPRAPVLPEHEKIAQKPKEWDLFNHIAANKSMATVTV